MKASTWLEQDSGVEVEELIFGTGDATDGREISPFFPVSFSFFPSLGTPMAAAGPHLEIKENGSTARSS